MAWREFYSGNVRIVFTSWPMEAGKIALVNLWKWMSKASLIPHLSGVWVDADEITLTFLNAVCIACKYDGIDGRIGKITQICGI